MADEGAPPPWWPHREASEFLSVGALRWHLQRFASATANAPTALLLHGTGAATHSWRHLAPLLAQAGFTVLAPDLPGHGFTATRASQSLALPDVARALGELLSVLHVAPALLIGHSAGAAIALRMALDGRVKPRLIVSINGAILPLQGAFGRLFLPIARTLAGNPLIAPGFVAWAGLPGMAKRLLAGTGSRIDEEGERCYAHLVADATHAAGALRLMASWDLEPLAADLPRLGVPLLLLAALEDRTLPPSHAARVKALLPAAQLVELPALGHLAHEEDAAATMAPILRAWGSPKDIEVKRADVSRSACGPQENRGAAVLKRQQRRRREH